MWPGITRASLVCLRFDDYHQDCNLALWQETLRAYADRGFRGLVAVPPKYEGERLTEDAAAFLHDLAADGWEIAQHGYTHEPVGQGRGGVLYQDQSEFAGLPRDEQSRRIAAGRDILREHDFDPTTFVPPWHEYDGTTVDALASLGFSCLNEGRWPLPRTRQGLTLVPTHVPGITPGMLAVGVVTIVGHPHLDADPMANAALVANHQGRLRTPAEIADWWQNRRPGRALSKAGERLR